MSDNSGSGGEQHVHNIFFLNQQTATKNKFQIHEFCISKDKAKCRKQQSTFAIVC